MRICPERARAKDYIPINTHTCIYTYRYNPIQIETQKGPMDQSQVRLHGMCLLNAHITRTTIRISLCKEQKYAYGNIIFWFFQDVYGATCAFHIIGQYEFIPEIQQHCFNYQMVRF